MPVTVTTLKKTLNHSVIKLVGNGSHTIALSSLVETNDKEAFFESGDSIIKVRDTLGIVIGGTVSGIGITPGTTVTEIHDHYVTLSAPTTADSSGDYTFDSQVYTSGVSKVNINKVYYDTDVTGGIQITRNSVDVLSFTRSGIWQFDGFSLSENNTSDIVVTLSGTFASTLIIEVRKVGGYGDADHPLRS
jgi:hypothetical protein